MPLSYPVSDGRRFSIPVYQYECECGEKFDVKFGTFKAAEPHMDKTVCPKCSLEAKRVYSPAAFHLHGSPEGWHKPSPAAKRIVNPDSITFNGPERGTGVK